MKKILISILMLIVTNGYARVNTEHYIFSYESGDVYDIKLTSSTVTWTGIKGSDKGLRETDVIKRKMLSNDVDVMQWKEMDGTFVTVVFDHKNLNLVSSIKTSVGEFLNAGKATQK